MILADVVKDYSLTVMLPLEREGKLSDVEVKVNGHSVPFQVVAPEAFFPELRTLTEGMKDSAPRMQQAVEKSREHAQGGDGHGHAALREQPRAAGTDAGAAADDERHLGRRGCRTLLIG